jgi:adenylylsulfate reductase subunit B
MSDGQISTQCPQPSQRVIYTKVGILFLLSLKLVYKISNGLAFQKNFLSPITTKPWGSTIPDFRNEAEPSAEMRNSELLAFEPESIRLDDGGLHTLKSNGLELKEGVYY